MSEERFDIEEIIAEIKSSSPPKKVSDSASHSEADGSRSAKPAQIQNKVKHSSKTNTTSTPNKRIQNKQNSEKKEPELFSSELDELFSDQVPKKKNLEYHQ